MEPKLRFHSATSQNYSKWELKKLGDISDIIGGGTPSTKIKEYWGGDIPWFTPTEISTQKYVNNSYRTITSLGLEKSSAKILPVGTVLLTTRATLGEMAICTVPVATNQGFQSIVPKGEVLGEFLYYLQPQIKKFCYLKSSGSTFLEINKSNLQSLEVFIPSVDEQRRIVEFFSLLDKRIEKQDLKVEALIKLKEGIINDIFKGELYFKNEDGKMYRKWYEDKLENIAGFKRGMNMSKGEISEDGLLAILYGELYTKYGDVIKDVKTYVQPKSSNFVYSTSKDILIPSSGETAEDIAKASAVLLKNILLGSDMNILTMRDSYNNVFFSYQLNTITKKKLITKAQGSSVVHLYSKDIKNIPVLIPELIEQEKLADLFMTLEKKIELEKNKAEYYRSEKKGYMQNMFIQ